MISASVFGFRRPRMQQVAVKNIRTIQRVLFVVVTSNPSGQLCAIRSSTSEATLIRMIPRYLGPGVKGTII